MYCEVLIWEGGDLASEQGSKGFRCLGNGVRGVDIMSVESRERYSPEPCGNLLGRIG